MRQQATIWSVCKISGNMAHQDNGKAIFYFSNRPKRLRNTTTHNKFRHLLTMELLLLYKCNVARHYSSGSHYQLMQLTGQIPSTIYYDWQTI